MTLQRGSCHCGAIRFEARGEIESVTVCNCSLCARAGYLHWYVAPEDFRLLTPEDSLETYQFLTRTARHHFCRVCGISPFRRPRSDPEAYDVNVRCLEGVDVDALEVVRFDGQHWEEAEAAGQLRKLRRC